MRPNPARSRGVTAGCEEPGLPCAGGREKALHRIAGGARRRPCGRCRRAGPVAHAGSDARLWLAEVQRARTQPRALADASAGPRGSCSTRRPTGCASRRSSRRHRRRAPTTSSRCRRSPQTRRSRARTRRRRSGRSARGSTRSTRSATRAGTAGWRPGTGPGSTPASRRGSAWQPPGSTRRPETPGRSTSSRRPFARARGRRARALATFCAASRATASRASPSCTGVAQLTTDCRRTRSTSRAGSRTRASGTRSRTSSRDWQQETYGDARAYAAAGTTPQQRRDALMQYLGHVPALANAGPDAAAAARGFLAADLRAARERRLGVGVGVRLDRRSRRATMQDYVSAQVYAARDLARRAPASTASASPGRRATHSASPPPTSPRRPARILDRLAAAIRDSGVPSEDPGSGACAPTWCTPSLDGAALTPAWQAFSSWSQAAVVINSPRRRRSRPARRRARCPCSCRPAACPTRRLADQPVALASTSPRGGFSQSPAGPWAPTLTVTIPAGSSSAGFYYTDTLAGTPTISAALTGQAAATQTETVLPGPLAKLALTPAAGNGRRQGFPAVPGDRHRRVRQRRRRSADVVGHALAGNRQPADRCLDHLQGGHQGRQGNADRGSGNDRGDGRDHRDEAGAARRVRRHEDGRASPRRDDEVVAGGSPAAGVQILLKVRRGSSVVASVLGRTKRDGKLVWRSKKPLPSGRYVARATVRSASTA